MEVSGRLHTLATLPPWKGLNGPQIQSGHCGEEKKVPTPAGNQAVVIQPVALRYTKLAINLQAGTVQHYYFGLCPSSRFITTTTFQKLVLFPSWCESFSSEGPSTVGSLLYVVHLKTEIEPVSEAWF